MRRTKQSILIIFVISTAAFFTIQAQGNHVINPDPSHKQFLNKANEVQKALKAQASTPEEPESCRSDELPPGSAEPAPIMYVQSPLLLGQEHAKF